METFTLTRRGEIVAQAGAWLAIAIALGLILAGAAALGVAIGPKVAVGLPILRGLLFVLLMAYVARRTPELDEEA